MIRRVVSGAVLGLGLLAQAAIPIGCSPSRDDSGRTAGSTAQVGPRYVCENDRHTDGDSGCVIETAAHAQPAAHGEMHMFEVTRYPGAAPTPEQRQAADLLVRRCHESAKLHGWYDFEKATADGFRLKHSDPTHYNNVNFLFDDRVLDPDRPEYLMFYDTPKGKQLVGFMFVPRTNTEEGPQIGGPLTRWHYHTWWGPICLDRGVFDVGQLVDGKCPVGIPSHRSPEMLHVWLLNHPDGPFATSMYLRPELLERLLRERDAAQVGLR